MGIYVNPGNLQFQEAVSSQIYLDKSEMGCPEGIQENSVNSKTGRTYL